MSNLIVLHAVVVRLMLDVADVAEAVPLAAFLGVVVIDGVVVAEQSVAREAQDGVLGGIAIEQRRRRVIDFGIEAEHLAVANEPGGLDDRLGSEEVEASEFVVIAENAPRGICRRAFFHRQLREPGNLC